MKHHAVSAHCGLVKNADDNRPTASAAYSEVIAEYPSGIGMKPFVLPT
ncbi:hypothetical protein ACFY93_16280 [Streptomyces sp. NPDC008313]